MCSQSCNLSQTFILTKIVTCAGGHPDRHGGPHPGSPGGGGHVGHGPKGGGLQPEIFRI